MLLAVAGLDEKGVNQVTARLASGDWSKFTPGDRAAFAFARKQARSPWSIDDGDVQMLKDYFGAHRTIDILWWSARCHHMTTVADAFQLPLEQENVFAGPRPAAKPDGKEGP